MKALLIEAARAAGRLLMERFERGVRVDYKGEYDLVTEADRAAEELIVGMVRARCPDHGILAEEGGDDGRLGKCRWIIDPLDGTTNYAHGFPWFAVSIAFEADGRLECGAVHNPYTGELYFAERGAGAWLNERRLRVSTTASLDRALLATGFAYDHKRSPANNYDNFARFQQAAQACRRPGAASLDLACIAAGRFDGFWELKLKPWDLAAGVLLVEEAGGLVSDFDGRPLRLDGHECLASNGLLHAAMQAILQEGCRPRDEVSV